MATKPTGRPVGRPQTTVTLRVGQTVGLWRQYSNGRSRLEIFRVAQVSGNKSGSIILTLASDEPGPVEVYVGDAADDPGAA